MHRPLGRVVVCIALLAGCNVLSGADGFEGIADTTPAPAFDAGAPTTPIEDAGVHPDAPPPDARVPPSNAPPPPRDGGVDASESVDAGPVLHVFVTSTKTDAKFNGVAGADEICQTRASAAGHSGTWIAWLSSSSSKSSARLTANGPWHLFDDRVAVASRAELTSGMISNPIDVDEQGVGSIVDKVWTGTRASDSEGSPTDCSTWNGFSCIGSCPTGTSGRTDVKTAGWTNAGKNSCLSSQRLYCFEN